MKYPAITIHQPWASWIAWGLKSIETRTHDRFASLKGQRIAIHAGLKFDDWAVEDAGFAHALYSTYPCQEASFDALMNGAKSGAEREDVFAPGAVVCLATVEHARALCPNDRERALCHCTGLFGLFLADVEPLAEPFSVRGQQGIWHVELPNE